MKLNEQKIIVRAAKVLSNVFRPSYFPLLGFVIMFLFTYLSQLPWWYKLSFLAIAYVVIILLPMFGIYVYRKAYVLVLQDLLFHRHRLVPYILHIICYGVMLRLLHDFHSPAFMSSIIVISLLVQCVCTVITLWWKISMHSAGVGAIMGALIAYSSVFHFNPVWWLCLTLLVSGLVNSSRMLLRQHTLWQVLGGTLVGFLCGLIGLYI